MHPKDYLAPLLVILGLTTTHPSVAQSDKADLTAPSPWADWVEPDFPFFSSVLEVSQSGNAFPTVNRTPRGLILNLGNDHWACFDTDLLRIAAIWRGKGVSAEALAPKSYHPSGTKTPGGQIPLPKPDGNVWIANGIYPGWQIGEQLHLEDPRAPAPSSEEVGRGPLTEEKGRFKTLRLTEKGVVLEYTAGEATVQESIQLIENNHTSAVVRNFEVSASSQPLLLTLGYKTKSGISVGISNHQAAPTLKEKAGLWLVHVPSHSNPIRFCVSFTENGTEPIIAPLVISKGKPKTRWPQEVATSAELSAEDEAYVVDNILLPLNNPWRRNVRFADIQFLADGTGVVATLDGDVWLVNGLSDSLTNVRWQRFTSGLHEPMTVAILDEQIFVFDRNGIWRLLDTDGNGEADVHELFSNAFGQTADMREFPSTIRLAPEGEFIIAKGGQQKTTLGIHNGSVLRVSADGRRSTVLGYGFRQPSIGVNIRTGLVTSSDQEGQYIPSTPLHIVKDAQFYGFLSEGLHEEEKYPAPIAEPITWIPHAVNASAISQVWLFDAKMGALNDALVHIGFNRPELFKILLNNRGKKNQAAVVSITTGFQFPSMNGSVNPIDGQLYVAGFQVNGWGNALSELAGLGRVRYTGKQVTLPEEVAAMDKGVLLRFNVELDSKKAVDPESYSLASWHYIRTHNYGSAQYNEKGEHGIDWLTPSSAYLSRDRKSVFIGIPHMKPVMQLRIGWSLETRQGKAFENNAYTTPYSLPGFDPASEGFDNIQIDLTPRVAAVRESGPVTIEEGRRLHQMMGCAACHSATGPDMAKVGPTWNGLFGSERAVVISKKRTTAIADEAYIRESLLDPAAKIVKGFEKSEYGMPSYAGVLTDSQIESLILFIKSIRDLDSAPQSGTTGPG
ncbi:MAG: cytochrome c [Verrucomicrobia bacterium]|nr:cytochrome c [Verrucomicrobiota bacterium]MDA1068846.1 cytochrome c [Verrucomicrobiota bacterium]